MSGLYFDVLDSPSGKLTLVCDDTALRAVLWEADVVVTQATRNSEHPILLETRKQLAEYFSHKRTSFDLPLAPKGTEFQKQAWAILSAIPYGETISYAEQARRLGNAKAMRAVGAANGKNPIPIIIPCHRVIGKDGSLTGFAAGVDTKRVLLKHEQAYSAKIKAAA